jgi:hypothetical protein
LRQAIASVKKSNKKTIKDKHNTLRYYKGKIVPRLGGLISNSSIALSLSNKNLPEKVQGSLESILLLVTATSKAKTLSKDKKDIYSSRDPTYNPTVR